jgi:hypothetical protein
MKKSIFISIILTVIIGSVFSQNVNKKYLDPKLKKEVLVGVCDTVGLKSDVFGVYYNTQFEVYKPKLKVVKSITAITEKGGYEFVTLFGDWCSDSKLQVGRFDKVLSEAGVDISKRTYIAVDRSKKVPNMDISKYNLLRVPTFIVLYHGEEAGRIEESADSTLEKDLLKILKSVK